MKVQRTKYNNKKKKNTNSRKRKKQYTKKQRGGWPDWFTLFGSTKSDASDPNAIKPRWTISGPDWQALYNKIEKKDTDDTNIPVTTTNISDTNTDIPDMYVYMTTYIDTLPTKLLETFYMENSEIIDFIDILSRNQNIRDIFISTDSSFTMNKFIIIFLYMMKDYNVSPFYDIPIMTDRINRQNMKQSIQYNTYTDKNLYEKALQMFPLNDEEYTNIEFLIFILIFIIKNPLDTSSYLLLLLTIANEIRKCEEEIVFMKNNNSVVISQEHSTEKSVDTFNKTIEEKKLYPLKIPILSMRIVFLKGMLVFFVGNKKLLQYVHETLQISKSFTDWLNNAKQETFNKYFYKYINVKLEKLSNNETIRAETLLELMTHLGTIISEMNEAKITFNNELGVNINYSFICICKKIVESLFYSNKIFS
jgi:hypothetical protein